MRGFKWIRKALTKRVLRSTYHVRRKVAMTEVAPSEKLVLGVSFAIVALICLTILQATYMIVFRNFSNEIFNGIMFVIGIILGTFFGAKT